MNDIQKNNLFYVCSLIEFIGRKTKNRRATIVKIFGKKELCRQVEIADVNHCLSFEQVSDEIIKYFNIQEGDFDSVGLCKYNLPSFQAFISDEISDFNSSVYYSTPEYLKYSYLEGKLLA